MVKILRNKKLLKLVYLFSDTAYILDQFFNGLVVITTSRNKVP